MPSSSNQPIFHGSPILAAAALEKTTLPYHMLCLCLV